MPRHKPVLLKEVLGLLSVRQGESILDATLGSGGHARFLSEAVGPHGRFIGMDQDPASLERCRGLFQDQPQVSLVRSNFIQTDLVLKDLNISKLDAVLIDTGFSSDQLEDPKRGISFEREGPLDMRLDPEGPVRARDLVNDLSQHELEKIFREYGEERWAERYARIICDERRVRPIETTFELIAVLQKALPQGWKVERGHRPMKFRRHFATKIFQALRITVNRELEILEKGLKKIWNQLNYNGRIAVISFHSLEDRIVKNFFRELKQTGAGELLVKKPVVATEEEQRENPRSRSAKLRGIRKIA